jgi:hypothetical protein
MDMPQRLAHWPLAHDAQDKVGGCHGAIQAVDFTADEVNGHTRSVACFDGVASVVTITDSEALHLGNRDFSISVWIKVASPVQGAFGTILSKFDVPQRCGINLSISGTAPAYNGMADARHVHFGIDDGYLGPWRDCGRPWPSNPGVPWVLAYDGALYCGMADADNPMDAAHVFRWDGDQGWEDCGRLGNDPNQRSSESATIHRGELYVSAGLYDWETAEGHGRSFPPSPTHVYTYEGGKEWRDIGQVGDGVKVSSLTSFEGDLYASLHWNPGGGRCWRYDGSRWHDCGVPGTGCLLCLRPFQGKLYAASQGELWRYDGGQTWVSIGRQPYGIGQVHCMQDVGGELWIGTWPQGYVMRYEGADKWGNVGTLVANSSLRCNEIMELGVYNGKVYAATLPKAQVYRYEAPGQWRLLNSLASHPNWTTADYHTWSRVLSLTVFQGKLFASTGSCVGQAGDVDPEQTLGRVYAMQAGAVASHDRDLGNEWTHLAAVRQGKEVRLYVNGQLSATSAAPPGHNFDLTNLCDLTIGYGADGFFRGRISDLRLYDGPLDSNQVQALATE